MRSSKIDNQRGLTLLEILIASIIFMIGFSLTIALLNNISTKLSTEQLTLADSIAEEVVTMSVITSDTSSSSIVLIRNEHSFQVNKKCSIEDRLISITVSVYEMKTGKNLTTIYHEYLRTQ